MPPADTPDADIVRRIQSGDREAYRILVDRYAPMVFQILRRYCDDEADVEDLAQDTFVRAYQNLDRFRGEAKFSSWLYRIAANCGKDFVKSARQQRVGNEMNPDLEQQFTTPATPHSHLESSEQATLVKDAVSKLEPDYATAFLLKYEMGLPYKEMALMLNTSVGALKVRVHRARKLLRSELEDKL